MCVCVYVNVCEPVSAMKTAMKFDRPKWITRKHPEAGRQNTKAHYSVKPSQQRQQHAVKR